MPDPNFVPINAWTDATHRSEHGDNRIGAGGVITQPGTSKILFLLACDITALKLKDNNVAELWANTLLIDMINKINEDMPDHNKPFKLNTVFTDSEYVERWADKHIQSSVEKNRPSKPLLHFFAKACAEHPDVQHEWIRRKNRHIAVADKLADIAIEDNPERLLKIRAGMHQAPCLYTAIQEDGALQSHLIPVPEAG